MQLLRSQHARWNVKRKLVTAFNSQYTQRHSAGMLGTRVVKKDRNAYMLLASIVSYPGKNVA